MIWLNRLKVQKPPTSDLADSILYDEITFYKHFTQDLLSAKEEVIIESPFICSRRMNDLRPVFERLVNKGIKVFIFTKDPKDHDSEDYEKQSENEIHYLETLGVQVLICVGNHHRKLAMIDRKILWEGSLNILSQTRSREIMRRINSENLTKEMFKFLKFSRWIS